MKQHQKVIAAFYPITVALGLLYCFLGQPPASYFSLKHNIFNRFFVKLGWLWVTVVYLPYLFLVLSHKKDTKQLLRGVFRYISITVYWYLMTQWFFGPSIIDRVFVATGGQCHLDSSNDTVVKHIPIYQQMSCRQIGGRWAGGHDVSGHCVMLIHASLFLWEEINWLFYSTESLQRMKRQNDWQWWSLLSVFGILFLWWWMVLMTSIYFHGHAELISGCVFGVLGWAVLYLYTFPQLSFIGLPPNTLSTMPSPSLIPLDTLHY